MMMLLHFCKNLRVNVFLLHFIFQDGNTALCLACKEGHVSIVEMLLAHPGVEVDVLNKVRVKIVWLTGTC